MPPRYTRVSGTAHRLPSVNPNYNFLNYLMEIIRSVTYWRNEEIHPCRYYTRNADIALARTTWIYE